MTDDQPGPEPLGYLGAIALGVASVIGVLLLLPGLCSLYFAPQLLLALPSQDFGDFWTVTIVGIWVAGFISGALGVLLITLAIRSDIRRRRSRGR